MSGAVAGNTGEKGRVNVKKVKRYWAGKAPEWLLEDKEEDKADVRTPVAPVVVLKTTDPRLARLAETASTSSVNTSHRRIHQPVVMTKVPLEETPVEAKAECEESVLERRARLRAKLLETRVAEEALLSDSDATEESESEEEASEDSESEMLSRPLIKPVFVSSEERETILERLKLEEEEELEWEAQKQKLQARKQDTKEIVAKKIQAEEEALQNQLDSLKEADDVNTDDDPDDETELEEWKEREIDRIKRDKEELLLTEKYAEEREKLKNMTEEERELYNKMNPKVVKKAPKKKWKFLQKYWHKGAYYQEDPDDIRGTAGTDASIFNRDYSDPTGEDKIDRSMLPKVMQVRDFGKSGRSKWTHLVNEDTTDFDNQRAIEGSLRSKSNKRMAGTEQEFQKPKKMKS